MIENTADTEVGPTTDLSHLVCGSAEWHDFVDEHGYDPTDLSDFKDTPNSPAVLAYTGVPAAVYAAPDTYDGPNEQLVQATLRTWRGQARRLSARPSLRLPSTLRPVVRANLSASRGGSAPGRRRATARAPSTSGGDDPPPASTGGLTGRRRQHGARADRGHFGVVRFPGARLHEGGSMNTAASTTSATWAELGDVFGVDELGTAHDLNVTDAFLIMPWSGFADREVAADDKGVLCVRVTAPDGTHFVFNCELRAECVGIEGDYNGVFDWNAVA